MVSGNPRHMPPSSDKKLTSLSLEALSAGQLVIGPDGSIQSWDKGMESLTGLPSAKVIGQPPSDTLLNLGRPLLADYLRRNDADGVRGTLGGKCFLRLAGTGHWLARAECKRPDGKNWALTEIACPHGETGAVLETVFWGGEHCSPDSSSALDSLMILAEHVPAGVALMQDGLLLLVNHNFCTMFGYSHPSELISKPASLLLVEGERVRHKQTLQSLDKQKAEDLRFQWTGVDKNGRKFWFEGRPAPIDWEGRPAVLSVVMDITEFKQREELIEKESQELRRENLRLKTSITYRVRLGNIIGKSSKMQEVFESILQAAASDYGIVIYGETGTGKELVAKAVHELSQRSNGPFVAVNCGAIPEELFEAEFFGHRKGSFTGAHADMPGFLDQARGGTLFLDEVAEISHSGQVKLLRALGSGEYTAIGATKSKQADFRVIVATNRDLAGMVTRGEFRQDLFYRIHVIPIRLPPLRERKEDIPFLVEYFLQEEQSSGKKMTSYDMAKLLSYDWPGNVRELRNALERFIAFGHLDFMPMGTKPPILPEDFQDFSEESDLRNVLMRTEKQIITRALEKYNWNRSHTAAALGLPRKTLFRKMRKLGIDTNGQED